MKSSSLIISMLIFFSISTETNAQQVHNCPPNGNSGICLGILYYDSYAGASTSLYANNQRIIHDQNTAFSGGLSRNNDYDGIPVIFTWVRFNNYLVPYHAEEIWPR
jgi:hypothetical protein